MLSSVSPYALLCASKPKPPRHQATAYDTYSLFQSGSAQEERPAAQRQTAPSPQRSPEPQASMPVKRTHYISDIHTRHASAMRSAPQSPASLQ